ncbi:MAG TPA: response regulator [Spirochaetota bacterium]|nr:response regulator [Spirochaetota bacterium]HOS32078.1 response regulator [Spirochaetota bacterium]HOS55419.1 response regulator [Spirochaetota bacterium]HPK62952.1 response regulator [Spirochaetota bacterium]HQF76867.1 response regulator [Spirochaetota bacterium]
MIYKKNAKILIIDDEIEICEMLKQVLTLEKFETKYYIDSTKFVEEFKFYNHENLDLIIIDLMMPKVDGFQLLDIMNSREDTRYIPKMVISAYQSDDNMKEVYKYGAIQFIEKPIAIDKFLYQVKTLLRVKLYEDNNRKIIELLKEKNKKLLEDINLKNKGRIPEVAEVDIKNIDNNLETISHLININFNLLKNFITICGKKSEFSKSKEYEILLDILVSMKALYDKKDEIDKISSFLKSIIDQFKKDA